MRRSSRRSVLRAGAAFSSLATVGCLEDAERAVDRLARSADDQSDVVWSYERGATAWSVRDGVCYARDDYDVGAGSLVALDAATGEVRWRFGVDNGAQPFSEPAVEDALYVGRRLEPHAGGYARFRALEFDGSVRWSVPLGHVFHRPVLSSGAVVVGSHEGDVHALETEDGSERWSTSLESESDRSERLVARVAGVGPEGVVVALTDGSVRGLDPATGAERWQFGAEDDAYDAIATLLDGDVYAGSGRTVGRVDGGEVAWRTTFKGRAHLHGRVGDSVVVSDDDRVVALDVADGQRLWTVRQDGVNAILVEGDRIHVGSTDVRTVGPDGERRKVVPLDGTWVKALASDGDAVYASTQEGVHRVAPDGDVRSTTDVTAATSFAFGDLPIVGTGDAVHALALE